MDAYSDPEVEEVDFMKPSQVGATELIKIIIGFHADADPCPILLVMPTLDLGKAFSKDRLAPMIRDTPCLKGKIREVKTRFSDNTVLHKKFPGGHLTITGSNSAASLRSRPIRVYIGDDIDAFEAGPEGDPDKLGERRTSNFWNKKKYRASSPTIKGHSRIEAHYEASDRRKYWVPCPHCGTFQLLKFAQLKIDKANPDESFYECEDCRGMITDADKPEMLAAGEWRAEAPFRGKAGFWINGIYSPWMTFGFIAKEFLEAGNDPEKVQVFTNTILAETFDAMAGETVSENILFARREPYAPALLPEGVLFLTLGSDTQDDRLEAQVLGWGIGEEVWSIEYFTFYGSPGKEETWKKIDEVLEKKYRHPSGLTLSIATAGIDTGGHFTKEAYAYCRTRFLRGVYAMKGSNQYGAPFVGRPTTTNLGKVKLFPIGVSTAKQTLYSRLELKKPGPRFVHFPGHYDEEYFKQLTASKKTFKKGRIVWVEKYRDEALDNFIYGWAAMEIAKPNLEELAKMIEIQKAKGGDTLPTGPAHRGRRIISDGV